jgi:hypothetical protein
MKKTENKKYGIKKVLLTFLGIIVVGGFTFVTIETATSGAELSALERKESVLAEENRNLKDSIVKDSSLIEIDQKSQELGFTKPSQIIYINGKEEFAQLPQ